MRARAPLSQVVICIAMSPVRRGVRRRCVGESRGRGGARGRTAAGLRHRRRRQTVSSFALGVVVACTTLLLQVSTRGCYAGGADAVDPIDEEPSVEEAGGGRARLDNDDTAREAVEADDFGDLRSGGGGDGGDGDSTAVVFGGKDPGSVIRGRQGVPITLVPGMEGSHVWDKQMHIGSNTFAFMAVDARILDGLGGQVKRGRSVHLEVDSMGWSLEGPALTKYKEEHGGMEYQTPVHHMLIWTLKDQTLEDMDELAERWRASQGGEQRSTDTIKHWQLVDDGSSFEVFGDTAWQVVVCMIHYNRHLTREEVLADANMTKIGCRFRVTGKRVREIPSTLVHVDISTDGPIESGMDYVRAFRYNDPAAVVDDDTDTDTDTDTPGGGGGGAASLGRVMHHADFNFHTHLYATLSSFVIVHPQIFAAACRHVMGGGGGGGGGSSTGYTMGKQSGGGGELSDEEAEACITSGHISTVVERASMDRSTQRCEGVYKDYNNTKLNVGIKFVEDEVGDGMGAGGSSSSRAGDAATKDARKKQERDLWSKTLVEQLHIDQIFFSAQADTVALCWTKGGGDGDGSYYAYSDNGGGAQPDFVSHNLNLGGIDRSSRKTLPKTTTMKEATTTTTTMTMPKTSTHSGGPNHLTLRYGDYVFLRCRYDDIPQEKRGKLRFGQTSEDEMCNIRFPVETRAVSQLSQYELFKPVGQGVSPPPPPPVHLSSLSSSSSSSSPSAAATTSSSTTMTTGKSSPHSRRSSSDDSPPRLTPSMDAPADEEPENISSKEEEVKEKEPKKAAAAEDYAADGPKAAEEEKQKEEYSEKSSTEISITNRTQDDDTSSKNHKGRDQIHAVTTSSRKMVAKHPPKEKEKEEEEEEEEKESGALKASESKKLSKQTQDAAAAKKKKFVPEPQGITSWEKKLPAKVDAARARNKALRHRQQNLLHRSPGQKRAPRRSASSSSS